MDLPVRTVEAAHERLMSTPGGRELMAHYVALEDIENVIRDIAGVEDSTKRRVMCGLRAYARGCDVVPYYLFTLIIGELVDEEEDAAGVRIIVNTFKYGAIRLPCIETHSMVAN